jgi:hypothetical protein
MQPTSERTRSTRGMTKAAMHGMTKMMDMLTFR